MNFDERAAPVETTGESSEEQSSAPRSIEDIADERADQQQIISQVSKAEQAEHDADRQSAISEHLIRIGCLEEFDWDHPAIPDGLVDRLVAFEADKRETRPTYDLTSKPDLIVNKIAQNEWEALLKSEDVNVSKEEKNSYSEFYESLSGSTFEKLEAIAAKADEFPEEAAHVAAFLEMRDLATTPEDAQRFAAKVNALDLSGGIPDPVMFVETAILVDDNFSDSYREAIAQKFDLPNPRVKTGGQVDQTLDARDENGKPLYTADHPVAIGDDSYAYENPDGSRVVVVDTGDGRPRTIPIGNESDNKRGLKISLAKIWARNEWDGATDFFGESVDIETDILFQADPQKLTKVSNTMNAILGGNRGFDGVIVQDNEVDFIGWFNQFTSTKGDAAIGDFDKVTALENRTNLGFHPDGNPNEIDYEVLRAAANFAKGQYGSGEPNYFTLQKHLNDLFPDRVPLTGQNAEAHASL
ncbi:MAG: hypothetical protein AAFP97_09485 [Pseudomonadota bacterium]